MNGLQNERKKRIEKQANKYIKEYKSLQELRKSLGLTQKDVVERLGVNQVNISTFEHRSDMLLSTLNSYVVSLGCDLEIFIKTPDNHQVKIENLPQVE